MKLTRTLLLTLVFAFSVATSASAVERPSHGTGAACDGFSWPVSNERAWFAARNLRHSASGVRLSRIDRAVELTLKPSDKVQFFLPPQKTPRHGSYSGDVTFFGVPRVGLYQVTISRNAEIDVFENGAPLSAVASSQATSCRGVRRSERYALAPGDLILVQISDARRPSIKVAFAQAP